MAIDFPAADPNIPDAALTGESLGTMHAGLGHPVAINRLILNIKALGAKLGYGASLPAAAQAVLRRTAGGQSAWGPIQAGDYGPLSIVNADIAALAGIAKTKLAALGIVDADVAAAGTANIAVAKLIHVGAGNVLKSNGAVNVAGQVATADIAANAATIAASGSITPSTATTSSAAVAVPFGAACTITTTGGPVVVMMYCTVFQNTLGGVIAFQLTRNAVGFGFEQSLNAPVANYTFPFAMMGHVGPPAGAQTFGLNWRVTAASQGTIVTGLVIAVELRR